MSDTDTAQATQEQISAEARILEEIDQALAHLNAAKHLASENGLHSSADSLDRLIKTLNKTV